jgi:hypothetical protein
LSKIVQRPERRKVLLECTPPFEPHDVDDNNGGQNAPAFGVEADPKQHSPKGNIGEPPPHVVDLAIPIDDDYGAVPSDLSDDALALKFTARHTADLRFVALWNKWILWNTTHWGREETLKAFDLARAVCRNASASITDPRKVAVAERVASAKTVAAVANLARSDRHHASTTDQWDADDWIFNPPTKGKTP